MANATLSTSVDVELLQRVEQDADENGVTPSEWVREAVRQKLQRETDLGEEA